MPFLPPNRQRQSTEGYKPTPYHAIIIGQVLFLTPNKQYQSNNNNDRLTAFDPGQPG